MKSFSDSSILFHVFATLFIASHLNCFPANSCYTSIFSIGDSIADTGNYLISLGGKSSNIGNLPYGETYFSHPTGRFSDGRIIIDFLAEALGLAHISPFLGGQNFTSGVNFAVGGATALDATFFADRGLEASTNFSLSVQMKWFQQYWTSFCDSHSDCTDVLSRSLFLVGEIGGNDNNYPLLQGLNFDETLTFVPKIINAISSTITELIALGARTLLVPGNFPIGCSPAYLTFFNKSTDVDYYDQNTGCIKWLNEFSVYHNSKLIEELDTLRMLHPYATIIYADYYNAGMSIYGSSNPFGYGVVPLEACCGGGGPYNSNSSVSCGDENVNACSDPWRYASWDGIHFTEAAYKVMANGLLDGSYTVPPFNKLCPDIEFRLMNDARQLINTIVE